MKRYIVASDAQVPYQNDRQINGLAAFIRDQKPAKVLCVGDIADLPMVSRWTKGRRGEFDGNINDHISAVKRVLEKLQITDLKEGNHDRRVETAIETYVPALSALQCLKFETLFGLSDLGVTYHRDPFQFAPNWYMFHGDEGPLSQKAGQTAMGLAERINASVVCSHTHRQAHIMRGRSLIGSAGSTLHGVEVGHMMRLQDATYLRAQIANWTAGFAVLDISGAKVQPYLIQMSNTGGFIFEGQAYEDGKRTRPKRVA